MNDKEQVIFEKFIDDHGAFLTSLSLEDNPEVIIAIMGENLNKDHQVHLILENRCQLRCLKKIQKK